MIPNQLEQYVSSLIPERTPQIKEMENYASEHGVPIMDIIGIETMLQILRLQQPTTILEIGTAIGYSAIRMAKTLPNTNIVTIERDEERYNKALYYMEQTETRTQITPLFGDALERSMDIKRYGKFDAIFIDAAKGQYKRFFSLYEPMLSDNGVIISDNILFKGLVTGETKIESRRLRSLIKKIKDYNVWLMDNPTFHTTILPIGDGIAISKKKR